MLPNEEKILIDINRKIDIFFSFSRYLSYVNLPYFLLQCSFFFFYWHNIFFFCRQNGYGIPVRLRGGGTGFLRGESWYQERLPDRSQIHQGQWYSLIVHSSEAKTEGRTIVAKFNRTRSTGDNYTDLILKLRAISKYKMLNLITKNVSVAAWLHGGVIFGLLFDVAARAARLFYCVIVIDNSTSRSFSFRF